MELGWELFECEVHPLGALLESIAPGWFWVGSEGGVASMAETEAERDAPEVGSHPVLYSTFGDDEGPVAVGNGTEEGLTIDEQLAELADLLREFAVKAERIGHPRANKALLRCVDVLNRYADGH
jgi:hypothetical protein